MRLSILPVALAGELTKPDSGREGNPSPLSTPGQRIAFPIAEMPAEVMKIPGAGLIGSFFC